MPARMCIQMSPRFRIDAPGYNFAHVPDSFIMLGAEGDFGPQAPFEAVREGQRAAMRLDDAAGDGKPEADATGFALREGSSRTKGWKASSIWSGGTPGPLSSTAMVTASLCDGRYKRIAAVANRILDQIAKAALQRPGRQA